MVHEDQMDGSGHLRRGLTSWNGSFTVGGISYPLSEGSSSLRLAEQTTRLVSREPSGPGENDVDSPSHRVGDMRIEIQGDPSRLEAAERVAHMYGAELSEHARRALTEGSWATDTVDTSAVDHPNCQCVVDPGELARPAQDDTIYIGGAFTNWPAVRDMQLPRLTRTEVVRHGQRQDVNLGGYVVPPEIAEELEHRLLGVDRAEGESQSVPSDRLSELEWQMEQAHIIAARCWGQQVLEANVIRTDTLEDRFHVAVLEPAACRPIRTQRVPAEVSITPREGNGLFARVSNGAAELSKQIAVKDGHPSPGWRHEWVDTPPYSRTLVIDMQEVHIPDCPAIRSMGYSEERNILAIGVVGF